MLFGGKRGENHHFFPQKAYNKFRFKSRHGAGMTKYRTDRKTAAGKAYRYHSDPVINLYTACRAPHDDSMRTLFPSKFLVAEVFCRE